MEFKIKTDDKPNLEKLLKEDKAKAQEVIKVFVELIEEACENGWHELHQLFDKGREKLTFSMLIKGVLHGSLDLPELSPEMYDILKEAVHPLSMLGGQPDLLNNTLKFRDWRGHYDIPWNAPVSQDTIAQIFRTALRYYRYVDLPSLKSAIVNNQVTNWRGLENPHMLANLPFVPALRYQRKHFGDNADLQVGRFYSDIGFFDLGTWFDGDSKTCPACQHEDIHDLNDYKVCLSCNGGWKVEPV